MHHHVLKVELNQATAKAQHCALLLDDSQFKNAMHNVFVLTHLEKCSPSSPKYFLPSSPFYFQKKRKIFYTYSSPTHFPSFSRM
mmetsp:Transcript_3253/g.5719  ORF Transcript_3253/g.5719 Transcript_3253/m.5719 type:complete len:84 (+) Transcript_3253:519-770(+)